MKTYKVKIGLGDKIHLAIYNGVYRTYCGLSSSEVAIRERAITCLTCLKMKDKVEKAFYQFQEQNQEIKRCQKY